MFSDLMTILGDLQASQDAYISALPLWVQWWMNWMGIVLFLGSLIFAFFGVEARWLLLAMFLTIPATFLIGYAVGWNNLWGITHLVLWTPVAIYMARRFSQIEVKSVYGVWYVLALATLWISLIFDVKDVGQYLLS
ncbi:hypothetical protein QMT40_002435 [Parvibaculaceae bacterium PLY_AMNH_Bact1]|nr:hypothetical protein QMT40_002435 [Parvibaculaceae bacterium PLY_AMNH_Bact1]